MKVKKTSIYQGPTRFTPVGESLTKQSFREEVDINNIVKRFSKGMGLANMQGYPVSEKNFGDFSDVPDLRQMFERMQTAQESFYMLPSKLRMKFDNDPISFLEFVDDPKNIDEMRDLGLIREVASQPATPAVEPSEAKAE